MADERIRSVREKFGGLDTNLAEKFTRSAQVVSEQPSDVITGLQTYVWAKGMSEEDASVWDALSAGYEENELGDVTNLSQPVIDESLERLEKSGKILRRSVPTEEDTWEELE